MDGIKEAPEIQVMPSKKSYTKDDAALLVKKLNAEPNKGRKHDQYVVAHEGDLLGRISVRRGSREVGHSFLPDNLNVDRGHVNQLLACTMSRDDYVVAARNRLQLLDYL